MFGSLSSAIRFFDLFNSLLYRRLLRLDHVFIRLPFCHLAGNGGRSGDSTAALVLLYA